MNWWRQLDPQDRMAAVVVVAALTLATSIWLYFEVML